MCRPLLCTTSTVLTMRGTSKAKRRSLTCAVRCACSTLDAASDIPPFACALVALDTGWSPTCVACATVQALVDSRRVSSQAYLLMCHCRLMDLGRVAPQARVGARGKVAHVFRAGRCCACGVQQEGAGTMCCDGALLHQQCLVVWLHAPRCCCMACLDWCMSPDAAPVWCAPCC
jgi:hypothetical protein